MRTRLAWSCVLLLGAIALEACGQTITDQAVVVTIEDTQLSPPPFTSIDLTILAPAGDAGAGQMVQMASTSFAVPSGTPPPYQLEVHFKPGHTGTFAVEVDAKQSAGPDITGYNTGVFDPSVSNITVDLTQHQDAGFFEAPRHDMSSTADHPADTAHPVDMSIADAGTRDQPSLPDMLKPDHLGPDLLGPLPDQGPHDMMIDFPDFSFPDARPDFGRPEAPPDQFQGQRPEGPASMPADMGKACGTMTCLSSQACCSCAASGIFNMCFPSPAAFCSTCPGGCSCN
jgi:hypothetical protein